MAESVASNSRAALGQDRPAETATRDDRFGSDNGPKRKRAPLARWRRERSFSGCDEPPESTATVQSRLAGKALKSSDSGARWARIPI